jgi:hypothetical protein
LLRVPTFCRAAISGQFGRLIPTWDGDRLARPSVFDNLSTRRETGDT